MFDLTNRMLHAMEVISLYEKWETSILSNLEDGSLDGLTSVKELELKELHSERSRLSVLSYLPQEDARRPNDSTMLSMLLEFLTKYDAWERSILDNKEDTSFSQMTPANMDMMYKLAYERSKVLFPVNGI